MTIQFLDDDSQTSNLNIQLQESAGLSPIPVVVDLESNEDENIKENAYEETFSDIKHLYKFID